MSDGLIRKLRVRDVEMDASGRLEMICRYDGEDHVLWFGLPSGSKRPHGDLIACVIAATFGSKFDEFELMEPVTRDTRERLEMITQAEWNAPLNVGSSPTLGDKLALNFSGGFDSLAALALLDRESTELVSMDFGGKFIRERGFFERFTPHIVETNIAGFQGDWTFMGAGTLLLAETIGASFMAFGSILEASPWNFRRGADPSADHAVFRAAGLRGVAPVAGLTEFGTTRLVVDRFPNLVMDSLASLADPHTEKYFRKLQMVHHALPEHSEIATLAREVSPARVGEYGNSFAMDFLAPGMFKFSAHSSPRWMKPPQGVFDLIADLDLDFYWKWNPSLQVDPSGAWGIGLAVRRSEEGLETYDEKDWDEIRRIVAVMKMFHKFPGATW
ncbi:hypothetical protein GCM10009594_09170 [Kocuria palustris]|uniref:hypothetical protein n=1 Tax=Kocuria palustris TaxID=71999 RepID=UPI001958DDB7|nr:hypothetical protein [Kocuria palustris]MBM7821950.1 cyanophycin synthetase [Kocuria palustris]